MERNLLLMTKVVVGYPSVLLAVLAISLISMFVSAQPFKDQKSTAIGNGLTAAQIPWPYPVLPTNVRTDAWTVNRVGEDSRSTLVMLIFPKSEFAIKIASVMKEGAAREVFEDAACIGSAITINGGFYTRPNSGFAPLGLLRTNGVDISSASGRRYGGFVTSDGHAANILARSEVELAKHALYALESSPLIIESGRDGMMSDDQARFDRIGIGTTKEGDIIIAAVFGENQDSVSLAEFSKIILSRSQSIAVSIFNMLAMDGGPSVHIYFSKSKMLVGDTGGVYLPDEICIVGR
jgi:hypothetical protein